MQIQIITLTRKRISLEIDSDTTIATIKEKLMDKEGIPPDAQRLIYPSKHVELVDDFKTAADYGMTSDRGLVEGTTCLRLLLKMMMMNRL